VAPGSGKRRGGRVTKVAAIVVNWHRWPLTAEALRSLDFAAETLAPTHELFLYVVDNETEGDPPTGLPDGTIVIRERENLGYGGGNNLGAERALRDHPDLGALFILNNDATIDGRSLFALVEALDQDPELGLTAPLLTLPDGTVESCGGYFGWTRDWWTRFDPRQRVDFVAGAAFLIRRAAWLDVGGFDLRYFHYVEDVDLGRDLKHHGWRLKVVGDARVVHQKSQSPTRPGLLAYYTVRNQILLWQKTRDLKVLGLNNVMRVLRFLVPIRHLWQGEYQAVPWAWRGLVDGLAGRDGRFRGRR
jgi:N-acetylglucosaminyl-diphospho-decaprenol L-rhamnosyltransferase